MILILSGAAYGLAAVAYALRAYQMFEAGDSFWGITGIWVCLHLVVRFLECLFEISFGEGES